MQLEVMALSEGPDITSNPIPTQTDR